MSGRDGTGPLGKGSRTGRGAGNCGPGTRSPIEASFSGRINPTSWGRSMWNTTIGKLFRRRRANSLAAKR